jgi:hypothetical protein
MDIVKECRGLVINTLDFSIVQKAFNRFYNLNESECTALFDWRSFGTSTKEDGSLIKVRWFDGFDDFFVTTRNSFAESICGESNKTWKELVLDLLTDQQKSKIRTHPNRTYVFELCTKWNQVVQYHPISKLVLLSIFEHHEGYDSVELYDLFDFLGFERPSTYYFRSLDEVMGYIKRLEETKDDTEGVVVRDRNGLRLKIKSLHYLKLHRLSNNGALASTQNLIPIILDHEQDEVMSYFPNLAERLREVELEVKRHYNQLRNVWLVCKDIDDQKTFALTIMKDHPTPYSGILFSMKKNGCIKSEDMLYRSWCEAKDLVCKVFKE